MNENFIKRTLSENIELFSGPPLDNNSYVIFKDNKAIIIDPGFLSDVILEFLKNNLITEVNILLTHFHYDHIGESSIILDAFPKSKIHIGKKEDLYLNNEYADIWVQICQKYNSRIVYLEENLESLNLFDIEIEAIACPAHTVGSYTYKYKNNFFTGDFLFLDCIGFLDEKYINGMAEFKKSMDNLAIYLTDNSIICPGHNCIGTWKKCKKINKELKIYWRDND